MARKSARAPRSVSPAGRVAILAGVCAAVLHAAAPVHAQTLLEAFQLAREHVVSRLDLFHEGAGRLQSVKVSANPFLKVSEGFAGCLVNGIPAS